MSFVLSSFHVVFKKQGKIAGERERQTGTKREREREKKRVIIQDNAREEF